MGRAAVVGRSVSLEYSAVYCSGISCPCIEFHILDVDTTTASKREIVTEEASLDKQSFATFGIIGKPNAPSIAHPLFRFIVCLGNIRTSDIALKTAIDETEVALGGGNCPSVIVRAAPVLQKMAIMNIHRGDHSVNAAPRGYGAISLKQTVLDHNIASAKAQAGSHPLIPA